MYPIGLSVGEKEMLETESLRAMKQAGIDAVELSVGFAAAPYGTFDFAALRKNADAAGMRVWSVHSQVCPDDSLSSYDAALNRRWIERMQDAVNRAAAAGIDKMIIHSCDCAVDDDRDEHMRHSMHCINELVEYAHPKDFRIALENLPRDALGNTPEEHLQMLGCNDKLWACFDFNHCQQCPTEDFLEKVAHRVITVHVSDRDDINERHWLPGEGVLDWVSIMDRFDKIGYTGVWMYEIGLAPGPTIDRPLLQYRDFVDNAHALFARKPPKKLGTPKPNLGMWGPKE